MSQNQNLEPELESLKKSFFELQEEIRTYNENREKLVELFKKLMLLLKNAPYKPKRSSVYLFNIDTYVTGPGNVYKHIIDVYYQNGKFTIVHEEIYQMNASVSYHVLAEDDKAVELLVKMFSEFENLEEKFERIIKELRENLQRQSEYFRNRNKKLTKIINEMSKIIDDKLTVLH